MTEIERLINDGFITEDFLKEEVRCEYRIPTEMKKAWAIQLDLLNKLFEVCNRLNLRIWVSGGTMLGAIRHKGYIPWDDDADVFMPRKDYDRLIEEGNNYLSEPYFIQSHLNEKVYLNPFARIRNSNTYCNENNCPNPMNIVWNNGIFVDIFPLDGADKSMFRLQLSDKLMRFETMLLHAYVLNVNKHWLARIAHGFLHLPFVPYNCKMANKRIAWYVSGADYDTSKKVGILQGTPSPLKKNIFDKSDWDETLWLPFENIKVPVPVGYDSILKMAFGDYMKFPPVEKRGNWHKLEFDAETPYYRIKQ